jgi:hypothetical protein
MKTRSRRAKPRRRVTRRRRQQRGGGIDARQISKDAYIIQKRVERDEGGVEDIQRS